MIDVGDGNNDIDIINFASCGVAMGNVCTYLKDVAEIVTDTNERSGVGKVLRKLFKFCPYKFKGVFKNNV